ncbi:MAG: hypothetical protein Fur0037_05190 [Planctomycetota bacterium]
MKFTRVEKGGRAERYGIRAGGVLVKVNGKPVTQVFEIFPILRDEDPDELVLTLQHEARIPVSEIRGGRRSNPFGAEMDGLVFGEIDPGGLASILGIVAGDTLVKIDGKDVGEARRMRSMLQDAKGPKVVLTLKRGDRTVVVKVDKTALGH